MCSSYTHLNEVLKRLAKVLENQLKEDTFEKGMKVTLDNFNKMIGVRVFGMPIKIIVPEAMLLRLGAYHRT